MHGAVGEPLHVSRIIYDTTTQPFHAITTKLGARSLSDSTVGAAGGWASAQAVPGFWQTPPQSMPRPASPLPSCHPSSNWDWHFCRPLSHPASPLNTVKDSNSVGADAQGGFFPPTSDKAALLRSLRQPLQFFPSLQPCTSLQRQKPSRTQHTSSHPLASVSVPQPCLGGAGARGAGWKPQLPCISPYQHNPTRNQWHFPLPHPPRLLLPAHGSAALPRSQHLPSPSKGRFQEPHY